MQGSDYQKKQTVKINNNIQLSKQHDVLAEVKTTNHLTMLYT